jgi:ATP-dependent exoDNAse (exonuclease V) alpha subunit
VLDRVNLTREELRYVAAYRPGMVLELAKAERTLGLRRGEYAVRGIDEAKGIVWLENERGRQRAFRPARMRKTAKDDNLALYERRELEVYRGDRIRWTRNDHRRGLYNADRARLVAIERDRVTVETSNGEQLQLKEGDPMLKRIDLAYALNAHMAQGLTSDRGIAVMDSRERNLATQKTFLVTVTRLRDHLTLVVDSAEKLGGAVARNKGEKASALEVTERLRSAAATGASVPNGPAKQEAGRDLALEKTRSPGFGI